MRYLIQKDKKRRKAFSLQEKNIVLFQSLVHNQRLSLDSKKYLYETYLSWSFNGSSTRLKNRCVLTGRSASVNRYFRLSRQSFRELALSGRINGVSKSSW